MKSFNFDKGNEIEIQGKKYEVKIGTADSYKKAIYIRDKVMKKIEDLSDKSEKLCEKDVDEVVSACELFVETILGEGYFEDIVKDANGNLHQIIRLLNFLVDVINEKKEGALNEYISR
jgi:hypothetical protein